MGVERIELKHEGDIPVAGPEMLDRRSVNENVTRINLLQPGNGPQSGRLSTSRWAKENQKLSILDLKI